MTMANRSVRFQDFLPSNYLPSSSSPVPLFSPTQVTGSERVLHRVFSPLDKPDAVEKSTSAKTPLKTPAKTAMRTPASKVNNPLSTSDIFYSPAQTAISSLSPFSALSRMTSSTSYRNLPKIEMLSYDYIQNCRSLDDLKQIVQVLQSDAASYPSLLRNAKKRLKTVRQQQSTTTSSRPNESSSLQYSTEEDDDSSDLGVVMPPPPPKTNSSREQELYERVQRLTQTIVEMEKTQLAEQQAFWDRFNQVLQAKTQAEERIQALEHVASQSAEASEELLQSMHQWQAKYRTLQTQLEEERQAREHQTQKSQQLEQQLSAQVQELTHKLGQSSSERKNHELNQLLRSAQRNLEGVKMERNAMLQALLDSTGQSAKTTFKQLSHKDRQHMIANFAKTAASSKSALEAMAQALSESERDRQRATKLHQRVEVRLRQMAQTNRRLEEENIQLTREIQQLTLELVESRNQVDSLIQKAHDSDWKQQQEDVYKQIIANLKRQLRSQESMVSVGLYKSAVEETKRLKHIIGRLETELRSTRRYRANTASNKDTVSVQKNVARPKESQCSSPTCGKKQSIGTKQTPLKMDKTNKENIEPAPTSARKPKNVIQPKENVRASLTCGKKESIGTRQAPLKIDKENVEPAPTSARKRALQQRNKKISPDSVLQEPTKTPNQKKKSVTFTFSPIDRPQARGALVRAAGGRKGLQEKLKQMRSPRARGTTPLKEKN